jgi:hypothetical protein
MTLLPRYSPPLPSQQKYWPVAYYPDLANSAVLTLSPLTGPPHLHIALLPACSPSPLTSHVTRNTGPLPALLTSLRLALLSHEHLTYT